MNFTPAQRIVLALAALGIALLGAAAGHAVLDDLYGSSDDVAMTLLVILGVAALVAAWATAGVLKLRK